MEPTDPKDKMEFWREHVRRVALFAGTQAKYAEQNGISASKLSYYKGILDPQKSRFAKVVPTRPEPPTQPVKESLTNLATPDPVWLARFVKELLR